MSKYVTILKLIKASLPRHAWNVLEYHGEIEQRQRDAAIEQFNTDPTAQVMLVSRGTGEMGLNLQVKLPSLP